MVNNMNVRRTTPHRSNPQICVHEAPQRPIENVSSANCCDLLCAVMEAHFFATDLKLYLDTHPDDKRALEMYTEACKQYKACKAAFEESCYPLTACSAGRNGCWDWPEGVWPPKN